MTMLHKSWRAAGALFIALVTVGFLAGTASAAETAARPNILWVMSDDHAAHSVSAYGSRINQTPNIDRLATEGMLFENYFCTNSICGPVRACILTGKYSHINGFVRNGNSFDGSQQTFPKLLQQAGYQTAIIGKWHLDSDPTGFDYYEVLYGQGPYYNPPMNRNGERVEYTGYTTEITADRVLEWLKNGRNADEPFMLMYHNKAPHREWQPGPNYLTMFDDRDIPEPATLFDDWSGKSSAAHQQEMTISDHLSPLDLKFVEPKGLNEEQLAAWHAAYDPKNEAFQQANLQGRDLFRWKYQRYIKDYLRCVAAVDDNLGRVLDYLDESGLADNTLVIYTSDQGFYLGDHNWYDKRWMYEESLRSPFLVRWPGVIKPGSRAKAIALDIDVAATFLEAAGAPVPSDLQGRSFLPVLRGQTPSDWRTTMYYHYYEFPGAHSVAKHYGVRGERYKLIHFYELGEWELYDLQQDPEELKNVYGDPNYADVTEQLKAELKRLREQYQVGAEPAAAQPRKKPAAGAGRQQQQKRKAAGARE